MTQRETPWDVILLDIEGTTTSIDFVYQELFPYARQAVADFLHERWHDPRVQEDVEALAALGRADAESGAAYAVTIPDGPAAARREAAIKSVYAQMDHDRKTTALKSLQGKIWRDGYEGGTLKGHVYDDVPPAIERWRARGARVSIYSSGSVEAQQLIFGYSVHGDLRPLIEAYFDTTTGPKKEADSYRAIVAALNVAPDAALFLTDNLDEARAAHAAGLRVRVSIRPGNPPLPEHPFDTIRTFDEVVG